MLKLTEVCRVPRTTHGNRVIGNLAKGRLPPGMDRWPEDYPNAYDGSESLDPLESEALRRVTQFVDDFSCQVRYQALSAPTALCFAWRGKC